MPNSPDLLQRNRELLRFQDAALLLARRLCGNIPDAEDVLQDSYLRAVNSDQPLLAGDDLRNWFLHVTANVARDRFRSEQRRRAREKSAAELTRIHVPLGADAELRSLLDAELSQLDERYRAPIALHYEQGLSYEEAAFVLGVPAPTLRVQASRGLDELRRRLSSIKPPPSASTLAAVLAVGFAVETAPALAASIKAIVEGTVKIIPTAAAPLLIPNTTLTSLTLNKAALIALLCLIAFVAGYFFAYDTRASAPTLANIPPQIAPAPETPNPDPQPQIEINPPIIAENKDLPVAVKPPRPPVEEPLRIETPVPVKTVKPPPADDWPAEPPVLPASAALYNSGLKVGHGNWSVEGDALKVYSYSYGLPGMLIQEDQSSTDATLEATLHGDEPGPNAWQGFAMCLGTAGGEYHGTPAIVARLCDGKVELLDCVTNFRTRRSTVIATAPARNHGREYTLKLVVRRGSEVAISVNGTAVLTHKFKQPLKGSWGLVAANGTFFFENIHFKSK